MSFFPHFRLLISGRQDESWSSLIAWHARCVTAPWLPPPLWVHSVSGTVKPSVHTLLTQLTFTITLQQRFRIFSYFIVEETEALRGQVTFPRVLVNGGAGIWVQAVCLKLWHSYPTHNTEEVGPLPRGSRTTRMFTMIWGEWIGKTQVTRWGDRPAGTLLQGPGWRQQC